jgi:hypothetical protein
LRRLAQNTRYSILVRIGVFQQGTKPAYQSKMTVDNVLEAVRFGMQREFNKQVEKMAIGGTPVTNETVVESAVEVV